MLRAHWRARTSAERLNHEALILYVDFNNEDSFWKRYYIPLLYCFQHCGYSILLRYRWRFFSKLVEANDVDLFTLRNLKFTISHPPSNAALFLTDRANSPSAYGNRPVKSVIVRAGYNVSLDHPAQVSLPYLMHPEVYRYGYHHVKSKRKEDDADRDILAFFAGNIDPAEYDRDSLRSEHGVATRFELVEAVRKNISETQTVIVETWDEKARLKADLRDKVVIVNSRKSGLDKEEYFDLLARSRFFLAMPGIWYPWAHNLAEALLMSCIPIIQFPRYISAELVDHENCIVFNQPADLAPAIRRCAELPIEEVQRMTRKARNFYESAFSPEAVVASIAQRPAENIELLIKYG
ncbi:MAG TPA: exostosin family protein [Verrucomicrobiae bacterium]